MNEIEYQKQITVDGMTYKIHIFMPSKAFKLGAKLAKFIGEPAMAMASAAGDEGKVTDVLPAAVKSLMNNLHEDEVWALIEELMTSISHEGKSVNVDLHFKGRLGLLMKVATQVIQFQFQDFFAAIGQAIAEGLKKAKAA